MDTAIAVDLGATHVRVGRVDRNGTIEDIRRDKVAGLDGEDITKKVIALISDVMDSRTERIGISAAGPVDTIKGCVVGSPNMRADEVSLTKPVFEEFKIPVKLLTDCKAGAIGEHVFGAAKNTDNVAYITVSTGIGCGVLQNGILVTGADGNAGEAGHFIVDTCYKMPCGCGGNGHWESCCSGTGIPAFFKRWCATEHIECIAGTADEILHLAHEPESPYAPFFAMLKTFNARGLQSVVCAYNPSMIVLDGPVALNHRWLFSDLEPAYLRRPAIVFSGLDGNAPLLGAAAYALKLY